MDSSISAALTETEMVSFSKGVKRSASPTPSTSEPIAEPIPEPVAEPIAEPITEPIAEPTAEPISEPTAQPITYYIGPKRIPAFAPGTDLTQLPLYGSILRQLNAQYLSDLQAQQQQPLVFAQNIAQKENVKEKEKVEVVEEPPKKKKKRTPNPNRFYDPEYPVQPEIRVHTRVVEQKDTLAALEVLRKRQGSLSSADNRNRYAIIAATGRVVSANHLRKKVEEMGITWEY